MSYTAPKGVFDILASAEEWRQPHIWQWVEHVVRDCASDFGYKEVRTPLFERTELFIRSVGEESDIVSKEMYTFEDKGKRSMTLRPEGTAPVMRAVVESKSLNEQPLQKLFYIGPMFRYERPQAGRFRQHHQFGAEAIGVRSPEQDVELIDLLLTVYRRLGLKNLRVVINCIGDADCRSRFRDQLRDFLAPHCNELSDDSQRRLDSNPLRILDSKEKSDQALLQGAPSILDALDEESHRHFERVKELLADLEIEYTVEPRLVRGLDYYSGVVFEVMTEELGAQSSVGGGGRYDGLIKELGGPDLPSIGFGTGMERIIQTLLAQKAELPSSKGPTLFLIPLGETASKRCFQELHQLRRRGVPSEMDFSGKKLKKVLTHADKIGAEYVVIVGDEELVNDKVKLKEMKSGQSREVSLSELSFELVRQMSESQNLLLQEMTGQLADLIETQLPEEH